MALKITANADHVVQLAVNYGRLDQFGGYKGWRMLAEAMDQLSDDIGEDIEVDIIAWCCDFTHAASADEAFWDLQHSYGWDIEDDDWDSMDDDWDSMDDEAKLEAIKEFLQENTSLVVCESNCIIWAAF